MVTDTDRQMVPFDQDILFWAFRYALGRRTYAVGDVAEAIKLHKLRLTPMMRTMIASEITDADLRGGLGDECDERCWSAVRSELLAASESAEGGQPNGPDENNGAA